MSESYLYAASNLHEWLADREATEVTIRQAFEAGEAYGADLERGAMYLGLDEYPAEAEDEGMPLAEYVQYRLLRQAREELGEK